MTTYTARLKRSANIRFTISVAMLIAAGVFLFWPNYQQLKTTRANIINIDEQNTNIALELEDERSAYRLLKNNYALAAITDESTITTILPIAGDETDIVRSLEQTARDISGDTKSLVLNSVNIGSATAVKDADYFALPIKIQLQGTKEKLMAFLHTLEKTGIAVENSEQATRLIDVQDVNLQLKDRGSQAATMTASNEEVMIDLFAKAYFLPNTQETTAKTK